MLLAQHLRLALVWTPKRAVTEYEKLAATYPSGREAVQAKISVARICLTYLDRPKRHCGFMKRRQPPLFRIWTWSGTLSWEVRKPQAYSGTKLVTQTPSSIQSKTIFAP
jgi:carbohydrate-binding DOMON domain-containing protein